MSLSTGIIQSVLKHSTNEHRVNNFIRDDWKGILTFPGQDVSRTGRFPDKTFPAGLFPYPPDVSRTPLVRESSFWKSASPLHYLSTHKLFVPVEINLNIYARCAPSSGGQRRSPGLDWSRRRLSTTRPGGAGQRGKLTGCSDPLHFLVIVGSGAAKIL